MEKTLLAFGLMAELLIASTSEAILIDRGNGLIYDSVLNITWTQNASLASCTPSPGGDKWTPCLAWADALVYAGFDDWRLTSMDIDGDGIFVDCSSVTETECRDNEYGYMFYYNLGGTLVDDKSGDQTATNGVTINNIHIVYRFGNFDYFDFRRGELLSGQFSASTVWAVRDGDSLVANVIVNAFASTTSDTHSQAY